MNSKLRLFFVPVMAIAPSFAKADYSADYIKTYCLVASTTPDSISVVNALGLLTYNYINVNGDTKWHGGTSISFIISPDKTSQPGSLSANIGLEFKADSAEVENALRKRIEGDPRFKECVSW